MSNEPSKLWNPSPFNLNVDEYLVEAKNHFMGGTYWVFEFPNDYMVCITDCQTVTRGHDFELMIQHKDVESAVADTHISTVGLERGDAQRMFDLLVLIKLLPER